MSDRPLDIDLEARLADFRLSVRAELPAAGVTAVFGPSGSGKTTLLRMIAGFDQPHSGHIRWGAETWFDSNQKINRAAHHRPVGYMFQDARLFAHLTVEGNLAYAAKRAPADRDGPALTDIVAALDLSPLLERKPDRLSGGEAQRVALGRTLLGKPELLLLDEPLSALDLSRKSEILPYLEEMLASAGVPALYVSHSVDEVARLADQVLFLSGGRRLASGPVEDMLEHLDTDPVTGLYEAGVLVDAVLEHQDTDRQISRARLDGQSLELPQLDGLKPGDHLRLRIRARDVAIATEKPHGLSIRNILEGRVTAIECRPGSAFADLSLALPKQRLRARITRASLEDLGIQRDQTVFALVKSVSFDSGGSGTRDSAV